VQVDDAVGTRRVAREPFEDVEDDWTGGSMVAAGRHLKQDLELVDGIALRERLMRPQKLSK
jgi:hypothetical protein